MIQFPSLSLVSISLLAIIFTTTFVHSEIDLLYVSGDKKIKVDGFEGLAPYSNENGVREKLSSTGVLQLKGTLEELLPNAYLPLFFQSKPFVAFERNTYFFQNGILTSSLENSLSFVSGYEDKHYSGVALSTLVSIWGADDFDQKNIIIAWFSPGENLCPASIMKVSGIDLFMGENPVAFLKSFSNIGVIKRVPLILLMNDDGNLLPPKNLNSSYSKILEFILKQEDSKFKELLESSPGTPDFDSCETFQMADYVSAFGTSAMIDTLVSLGYPIDKENPLGSFPIHLAALHNQDQNIKRLADLGADINAKDQSKNTPLHVAVASSSVQACKTLMDLGCKPTTRNKFKATPIDVASNTTTPGLVKLLHEKGAPLKLTPRQKQRLLIKTILLNDVETAQFLIDDGASIEKNREGVTPLHVAAKACGADMIQMLVNKGIPVDKPDSKGRTPLMLASANNIHAVKALLDFGADPNHKTDSGYTALHTAVVAKNLGIARLLLSNGANPNTMDSKGEHIMLYATEVGSDSLLSELVAAGASCELTAEKVLPLMEYAFRNNIPEFVDMSLGACLTPDFKFYGYLPALWVADYYQNENILNLLKAKGAQIENTEAPQFAENSDVRGNLVPTQTVQIPYPIELQEKYGEFRIKIEFLIDPEGNVRLPKTLDNPAAEMENLIADTLNRWKFKPIWVDGVPNWARIRIPMVFTPAPQEETYYEVSSTEVAPIPVRQIEPTYPSALKKNRINGQVVLVFIIDPDGNVINPTVESSSHEAFERPALQAISRWKFSPGFVNGEPVNVRVRAPLIFKVN